MKKLLGIFLFVAFAQLFAQSSSLFIPLDVQKAYENGTRDFSGKVTDSYWINSTDYKINAELIPNENLLTGNEEIVYHNESPDTLFMIVIRLYQNIAKATSVRDWRIPEKAFNDGVRLKSLSIQGVDIDLASKAINIDGTNMVVYLTNKLLPNEEVKINISWEFNFHEIPFRMGNFSGDYFIAYWYPQVAVYDDVYGWDRIQYSGTVEFYNDFNNFDINFAVPDNYVIWATGELKNCKDLFHKNIIKRIKEAKISDEIIHIITPEDYKNHGVTVETESGKNSWHFVASKVPDVALAVSNNYNWDGGSVEVEPGRRVFTTAVYPDSLDQCKNDALYAQKTIKYMSFVSPKVPYPWPHTTAFVNKGRGGGMEFPMMQNNGAPEKIGSSAGLVFHEIVHSYFPFYMGTNERRAAWMDEGWASFFPRRTVEKLDTTYNYQLGRVKHYETVAGTTKDMPMILPSYMMTHGESRNTFYNRPEVAYEELRNLLGDELFYKALREYMNRWNEKHPIAYDFFFTFNEIAGEDLTWFWKPWFFELGYPDLKIDDVEVSGNNVDVRLSKIGNIPTRIELTFQFEDGTSEILKKSASLWKENNTVNIEYKTDKKIKSVKLGNELIPDVNRKNNSFEL